MKNLLTLLFVLSFLTACKKETTPTITTTTTGLEYPENWGMVGTIGADSFRATSLNASLIHDTLSGAYRLNVNGWNEGKDQTIYLSYPHFSFAKKSYLIMAIGEISDDESFAYYNKDHTDPQFGTGGISIESVNDTLVKGSYNFTTRQHVTLKGVFTIRPHVSYQ